jgi:hypothetical protein
MQFAHQNPNQPPGGIYSREAYNNKPTAPHRLYRLHVPVSHVTVPPTV